MLIKPQLHLLQHVFGVFAWHRPLSNVLLEQAIYSEQFVASFYRLDRT